MKHLPIYRMGRIIGHAKLDDADYEWAQKYRWYIQTRGSGGKPQVTRYDHSSGSTQNVFLAREIMGIHQPWREVYPLDGDPYNLQGANLAVAGRKRRVQHQSVRRRMGQKHSVIPQLGISPIVKMASAIEGYFSER